MKYGRKAALLLAAGAALLSLFGCGNGSSKTDRAQKQIWYLNSEENGLEHVPYEEDVQSEEAVPESTLIDSFLTRIQVVPENTNLKPLLYDNVRILSNSLEAGVLTLNFSDTYKEMSPTREVLARAGIVRTFVQLDAVSGVLFQIEGQEVVSPSGTPLGVMNENSFVEDAGKQINAIQHVAINLYFTGEDGKTLKREARSIYYTASKPLEWAVVERIIAGPKVDGNYPTVPANTQIISVSSANGTCYVNLNQTFFTNALNIGEQIPIYSIVNSLIDDCKDITQVQISVEGENNIIFRQTMDLSHPYEADYTLVETPPQTAA